MKNSLEGIYIPAVTPFDCQEMVSEEMLVHNIEKWNQTDVSGYMCLGSNGEFRMLDDEESLYVIKIFAEHRAETKALIEYFTAVADFSRIPILLYCAPGFANTVCISCDALKVLADHPNIRGIKDTSLDMMNAYMDAVGNRADFQIMSGSVNTLHKCLKRGGESAVVSAANYFPQACAKLISLWQQAGEEVFLPYYNALCRCIRQTGARGGVAGVKACMNLCGYRAGIPRKPVQPLDDGELEELRDTLFLNHLYF